MTRTDALRGRLVLVTGASRGIGRRTAERLAEAGAQVWAAARSQAALAELQEETGARPLVMDVTDDTSVWAGVERILEESGGPPHVVVNAAGVFSVAPLTEETVKGFDRNVDVNLRGAFLVVRALLPAMLGRGDGLLVNVGSVSGRRAFPGNAAYSASKFGLRGMHEVLLEELRGTGVRATLLEPAATDTSIWDPLEPDADPHLPDRADMLSPDDVAEAVLFLATRPARVRVPVLSLEHA